MLKKLTVEGKGYETLFAPVIQCDKGVFSFDQWLKSVLKTDRGIYFETFVL